MGWSMASLGMCKDDLPSEHLEVLIQRAKEDILAKPQEVEASHISNAAWACAKADLRGSSRALVKAAASIAADALDRGTWSLKHLVLIAWSVVLQCAYSKSTANYVRRIYDLGMRNVHDHPLTRGMHSDHLHQLVMINAALKFDDGLR